MNNLKNYDEFHQINEDLGVEIFLGIFFTIFSIMAMWVGYIYLVKPPVAYIRRYINKLRADKQFKRELIDIIHSMTKSQKRELKRYVKNSVFAKWDIQTTYHQGGSETSYDRDPNLNEEKQRLLDIFEGEQREKLENLLTKMEDEILHQTMRDSDKWGVKNPDPNLSLSWKPKLDLRSLKDKSREEEWMGAQKKIYGRRRKEKSRN